MSKFSSLAISLAIAAALTACSDNAKTTDATKTADNSATKATSSADVTTLRFSYFWPATSNGHKELLEPWAKNIEAQSNGRLKIELYPSAGLAKPDVTNEAVAKGTIDIGSQANGWTNGRFPLTQIAEMPSMSTSATQLSCLLQTLVDNGTLADEYKDTKVLFLYGVAPGFLHTKNKAINTPADLKGMRVRHPSAVAAGILEELGATPVGMPIGDVYTSLERGVIDSLSVSWDTLRAFRLDDITKNHTVIPYYSSAVTMTMNQAKYDSLPDDLKKVIDDNSGMAMAMKAGQMFDAKEKEILDDLIAKGHNIINVPNPMDDPNWGPGLKKGTEKYLQSLRDRGIDADGAYAKAKEASEACKVAS